MQKTFLEWSVIMCHPGGAELPFKPLQDPGTLAVVRLTLAECKTVRKDEEGKISAAST